MVNQTSICFKADSSDLQKLDFICSQLGCKCNKLLNFFLHYDLSMLHDPFKSVIDFINMNIGRIGYVK